MIISSLCRSTMRLGPQYFQRPNSLFHLFSLSGKRMCSTDNSQRKIDQLVFNREHSVVIPLGSQQVYVPSEKQKALWAEKIALVDEYVGLDPEEKKFELMRISIQRFSHFMGTPVPRMETEEDLNQIFAWVHAEVKKKQIDSEEYQYGDKIDFVSSITTTINKLFAEMDFSSSVRIQSVSEYFWYSEQNRDYIYPFASYPDELHTMIQMGLPYLDSSTLYHEVGIGSGEGLIEVLRRSLQENKMPGCIVGTDLNRYSLESIRMLVEEKFGGLENVFLRYSNAADPIDDVQLNFSHRVLVLAANRFFSILDPKVFDSVVGSFSQQMKREGYLVAGISLLSPENLARPEMFIEASPGEYFLEEVDFGSVWYRKNPFKELMEKGRSEEDIVDMIHTETSIPKDSIDISKAVMQVYYDPDKFIEKIEKQSFAKIDRKLTEEYSGREVILFKKQ